VETFYEEKKTAKTPVVRNIAKLMLNSLYGKFGMKDIQNTLKIVSKEEANKIIKQYNYSIFSELRNGKIIIKYSTRISPELRNLFKDRENINGLNESLYKERGVPSAVQIASAIAGYTKLIMHKYKNIPDNPCIYTDTDSIVLKSKLPGKYLGKEIGQMKIEHIIKKGIFAGKKLYCIINNKQNLIIKASGIDGNKLSFKDF
jgi:DNA polymerase type B, organellar and viral